MFCKNKCLFHCLLLGILFFLFDIGSAAQISSKQSQADSAYKMLNAVLSDRKKYKHFTYLSRKDSLAIEEGNRERVFIEYRKKGIEFWKKYPNDIRRYEWFKKTIRYSSGYNHYWADIKSGANSLIERPTNNSQYAASLNWEELKEWENLYRVMLEEYKVYCEQSGKILEYRETLCWALTSFLRRSLNIEYRKREKLNLDELKRYFLPAAEQILAYKDGDCQRRECMIPRKRLENAMNAYFVSIYREFGINSADMERFYSSLYEHPLPGIREWSRQGGRIFLLMDGRDEFRFSHKTIDGVSIDLKSLRGKVVLIDFWATWCTVCIDRMPAIRQVYEKYKYNNFIVLSACLNPEKDLSKVKVIKNKIGADWPTLIIGSTSEEKSLGKEIWEKYNFWGVPQLLLFDKKGNLVLLNDVLRSGDFEPTVKRLIAE